MSRVRLILASLIALAFFFLYFSTQSQSIFGGDAGDIVTAAYTGGVAHPPGYPIYTALGYAITHALPTGSVAWRMAFLSSIPIALSMGVLFLYITLITSNVAAAFVAVGIIGTSYLYWLYASVPEVFGLHILFMTTQLLALALWTRTHKNLYGHAFVLLFLLSLSHQHIVLFLVPAFFYILFLNKKQALTYFRSNKKNLSYLFLISLLPILYFVFSIPRLAAYTWEVDLSLLSIIKIITRSAYGTFTSAAVYVEKPISRLSDVYAFFIMMVEDLTLPGIALATAGAVYQFFKDRKNFFVHMIGFLFTGPLFFFYGAYILTNSFTIATFERFIMPSYIFIAVWIAMGVLALLKGMERLVITIRSRTESSLTTNYAAVIIAVCLLIPLNLLIINYPKISVLKNDQTAELLAQNILDSADKNAILMLSKDNEIFNVSYENIVNNYRPDVMVINKSHLFDARRYENIKKRYPDIQFPNKRETEFDQKFIEMNVGKRPIYTNDLFGLKGEYMWVREGLMYKLYPKSNPPKPNELLQRNDELWASYHDPYSGSLSSFKHLMLASNLLLYRIYRSETGDYFFVAKDFQGAERHYKAALRYDDGDVKTYIRLSTTQMELKKCSEAEDVLTKAHARFPENTDVALLFVKLYTDCTPNSDKATEWRNVYQGLDKKTQQQLQQL